MRHSRTVGAILTTISAALILLFVWPTTYRPIIIRTNNPRILAAREHRLTGRVELLTRRGWQFATADTTPTDPLAGYTADWRTRDSMHVHRP